MNMKEIAAAAENRLNGGAMALLRNLVMTLSKDDNLYTAAQAARKTLDSITPDSKAAKEVHEALKKQLPIIEKYAGGEPLDPSDIVKPVLKELLNAEDSDHMAYTKPIDSTRAKAIQKFLASRMIPVVLVGDHLTYPEAIRTRIERLYATL